MHLLSLLVIALDFSQAIYNHYRLPTSIWPKKYNLRIVTDLDDPKNLHFNGSVNIELHVAVPTKNITLHAKYLIIDESKTSLIDLTKNSTICFLPKIELNLKYDYYIIHTCNELKAGTVLSLSMHFAGALRNDFTGYFVTQYRIENTIRYIAVTQFEPLSARKAFPCFDEPIFKAKFTVALGHHRRFNALSNMPRSQVKTSTDLPNYVWSEFQESKLMSTYLVAYTVNDYVKLESNRRQNGVQCRIWVRPNAIHQMSMAAELQPIILEYFENLFGIRYPLPKMDFVTVPGLSVAMENWGMITFGEDLIMQTNSSTHEHEIIIAKFIVHELAHQWLGNLNTMKWWNDLWLNEGIASYFEQFGINYRYPEWEYEQVMMHKAYSLVYVSDALATSHPVSRPVYLVDEMDELFDLITYDKGMLTLNLLYNFIGYKAFIAGIVTYLNKHAYQNSEQDELWDALSYAAHSQHTLNTNYSVKTIMDSWTLQTGYPLVYVTRNYKLNTVKFRQQRFLLIPKAKEQNTCWWLPISLTTGVSYDFNSTRPALWLECTPSGDSPTAIIGHMPGDNIWILANVQQSVLARFNYDRRNWQLLIETLKYGDFERIHVLNRAQLIEDIVVLAMIGEQNCDLAIDLVLYLRREKDFLPWTSALSAIGSLDTVLSQPTRPNIFKTFVRYLLNPIYDHLQGMHDNFAKIQDSKHIQLKSNIVSWSCSFNVSDCQSQCLAYFRRWRQQSIPIPKDLRAVVLKTAIYRGNDDDWEFVWMHYNTSTHPDMQFMLLSALGNTQNATRLKFLLDRIWHLEVQKRVEYQDSLWVIANNQKHPRLGLDFFIENWKIFLQTFSSSISTIIDAIAIPIIQFSKFDIVSEIVFEKMKLSAEYQHVVDSIFEHMRYQIQCREQRAAQWLNDLKNIKFQ